MVKRYRDYEDDAIDARYPRTRHLPWSLTVASDDRMATQETLDFLKDIEVIYTEKLDGENTVMSNTSIHARSPDGYGKGWQSYMLSLWYTIRHSIPPHIVICGENMFAVHSITYERLTAYFYVFNIFDIKRSIWLSWDDTVAMCQQLNLATVPVIHRQIGLVELPIPAQSAFGSVCEGYVVRPAGQFSSFEFHTCIAKCVRANHVTTDKHWSRTWKRAKLWKPT